MHACFAGCLLLSSSYGKGDFYLNELLEELSGGAWEFVWAQQWFTMTDQLNMGVRELMLDPVYVFGEMRLCHCGTTFKWVDAVINWLDKVRGRSCECGMVRKNTSDCLIIRCSLCVPVLLWVIHINMVRLCSFYAYYEQMTVCFTTIMYACALLCVRMCPLSYLPVTAGFQ